MTHEQLIAECTQWFWNSFPDERRMLYAINNNVSAGLSPEMQRREGAKNKAKGVVAGVLDLCYITYEGKPVYMDAKIGKDTLSDEQIDFTNKLTDRGLIWFTFSTLDEFKHLINILQNG